MTALFAESTWSAPELIGRRPATVAAMPTSERARSRRAGMVGEAPWIATETALNRWCLVSVAALSGREVILTHRGWPTLQLVPATAQQQAMHAVTGRTGKCGRKARTTDADDASEPGHESRRVNACTNGYQNPQRLTPSRRQSSRAVPRRTGRA
jgi:antitoxin (DNA-binding transcriptional repressor) of toxin-antitoxin stability system